MTKRGTPKVLINKTKIEGFNITLEGDCDENINKLVNDLQWDKEF